MQLPLTSETEPALLAAAVLERFSMRALQALQDTAVESAIDQLLAGGLLRQVGHEYELLPEARDAALHALEASGREPSLRDRAIQFYAKELRQVGEAGHCEVEHAYMRQLEARCEALIRNEPTQLHEVTGDAPIDQLRVPRHRHLVRYYQAMSEGLLEHYGSACDLFGILLGEPDLDDMVRARVLNSSAVFLRLAGHYEQARDNYAASRAIWHRLGNPVREGIALMNQGTLSYCLQDYAAAERDLRSSLLIFEGEGETYWQASAQSNLGLVARDQGRWDEARRAFDAAKAIFEREGPRNLLGYVTNNIGEVELLQGNFAAAVSRFETALTQMTTQAYSVDVYVNLGLACEAQGKHGEALRHYAMALALAEKVGRREIVALVRFRYGHAMAVLGEHETAQQQYDAAIAVIEDARAPMRDEGLLISLMGRWQQVFEAAVLLCLERGDVAGAFGYAERARARAFADVLQRACTDASYTHVLPVTAAEVQRGLPTGTLLLAYFASGLHGPDSALLRAIPPEAAGLRATLHAPRRLTLFALSNETLRAHDCALDPNMLSASSAYQVDGRRFLQKALLKRAHAALIAPVSDLLEQAQRTVIAPHGPLHQLPFAALIDPTGQSLLDSAPPLSYTPSATVLLRVMRRNSSSGGPHGTASHHQGVVPAGLARIGQPDEGAVVYTGSKTSAGHDPGYVPRAAWSKGAGPPLPSPPRRGQPPSVLALGYDGAKSVLRHTEPEAAAVAAMCGGVMLRGRPGIGADLRDMADGYHWLHLACHGEFNRDDPLQSFLEIGPGERLCAAEIIEHWRLQAELVTLSACRSGVSQILRGDEPMGLVRAFLYAGVQTVLVTLWQVEDISARIMAELFYDALLRGGSNIDPAKALQAAQQGLRALTEQQLRSKLEAWSTEVRSFPISAESDYPFDDPQFWAAYVIIGGAAPASTSN